MLKPEKPQQTHRHPLTVWKRNDFKYIFIGHQFSKLFESFPMQNSKAGLVKNLLRLLGFRIWLPRKIGK